VTSTLLQARPLAREAGPSLAEIVAWSGLILAALLVRIVRLGEPPLDPTEGRRALEALTLWREGRVSYEAGPLLTNVLSLVFGLFTAGDGQARIVSALTGTGMVLIPALLRPTLGPWASWCAAAAIAICPPLIVASRTASPAILVAAFVLLVAGCAQRFADSHAPGWLTAALVSGVLGLAADPSFTVAIGALVVGAAIAEGDVLARPGWWQAARDHARGALGVALITAVLVDTRFMTSMMGIEAGVVEPLWRWSTDVVRGAGLTAPALLLLIDGGTLALAAIGLMATRAAHRRAVRILGAWLVVALALTAVMRQPDLRYLIQPLLPATLLAGFGLAWLIEAVRQHGTARSTVVALVALAPLVTAGFQINASLRAGQNPWLTASIVALAGWVAIAWLGWGYLRAAQLRAALATLLLVVVALWGVTSSSRLLEARGSERGQLLSVGVLTDDIRLVRQHALKWLRADPSGRIPVDSSLRPITGWSLRDVPTVRYEASPAERLSGPRVLATSPQATVPGSELRQTRLVVGYAADFATLSLAPERVWRWVVGRQSLVDLQPYAIVLVEPAGT
jgi:hypothetical protein